MMGKNKGFNSRLKEKVPYCIVFHCLIHSTDKQTSLWGTERNLKDCGENSQLYLSLPSQQTDFCAAVQGRGTPSYQGVSASEFRELKNQIKEFLTLHSQKLLEEMTVFLIKTSYLVGDIQSVQ